MPYVGNKLEFRLVKDNSKLRREFRYYENLMLGPAAKEIKSLGLYGFFIDKWKRLSDEYARRQKQTQVRRAVLGVISRAILGKDLGGTELSGGQWQKLAIARGWYRNRGTHDSLMDAGGEYARLHSEQSQWYER